MTDHELVRACLEEIYRQNGYDDMAAPAYRDHEHVSHQIEAKTATLISVSTLKRLLNAEFSRIPQAATLHALAQYLGYPSWQEYKVGMRSTVDSPQSTVTGVEGDNAQPISIEGAETRVAKDSVQRPGWLRYATLASGGVVAMAIVVLFIRYSAGSTIRHAELAAFSAQKVTDNDIPNTVVFHYNIDDVQADSFFIQQSWDVNRRVRVYKNTYTLTDVYYEPGYHVAKLMANDSVIRTVDVSIPTDAWFLCVKAPVPTSVPELLVKPTQPVRSKDGIFRLDPTDPVLRQVDLNAEKNFVYAYHPSELTVNSDNYTFKTRLRVTEVKHNACPNLMVEILTQRYFMFFRSAPKGCSGELFTEFGEKFLDGRKNDLSAQAYDVTQWADVEVTVKNRTATVIINGQQAFTTTYKDASGFLTGLAFISNGIPEIDYIDLHSPDGTVFFHDDFDPIPQPLF
jgi:hypothetical protein